MLPFTVEQFFDVFRRYNLVVWPLQWVFIAMALAAVALALSRSDAGRERRGTLAGAILALLWLWMGLVYHIGFFRAINPAALLFGVAFIIEAALLAWIALVRGRLVFFAPRADARGIVGALLLAYALLGYPALRLAFGHRFPAAPTFGLPCPTTIFTLGLLLWAEPTPRASFIVPLLWSIVGTQAAFGLGVPEDFGLGAAGILAALALALPHAHASTPPLARAAR